MSTNDTLEELLNQLTTGGLEKQIEAGAALSKLGAIAVDPLIKLLNNPEHKDIWWLIAGELGRIGDHRAVEPLITLLRNPLSFDAMLARKYTAWALADLKDIRAVEALIELLHEKIYDEEQGGTLDEPDCETREAATFALSEIGDPRAVEPIFQSIVEGCYQDSSGLAQFGEPAFKFLLDALNNTDENVRGNAASLLGEFGALRATEPLIALLQYDSSDEVRSSAAYSLSELCDPRAYDAMANALNDQYEQTRAYAAVGLGRLKDSRAVELLTNTLQDENPFVRSMAQWALDWIEQP